MNYDVSFGNSLEMWIVCIPLLSIIIGQAVLIYKKAMGAKDLVALTPEESKTAFKTGLITAIGPSFSSFISIIAMASIMGGPVTWMRTSIIASASTELRACTYTAEAAGAVLGGAGFTIQLFDACLWVMALNGCGWILFCLLFTDKMTIVTEKISGGSTAIMSAFATSAILGTMAYMSSNYIVQAIKGTNYANFVALIGGLLGSVLIDKLSKKMPSLKSWKLGIALILGMFCGALFQTLTA